MLALVVNILQYFYLPTSLSALSYRHFREQYLFTSLNYSGVHRVARVSSNVNKPPYATMFGARFYCAQQGRQKSVDNI
jgi:hypothetical protein